ncbi:hypothetical protein F444_09205 [Phytophthora nicotianae P1976]|uniref:Uncharacterized protein n=1 Tax=Phytophthora nicotianae P1976 TaxID=1317066 RepID=A0A081A8E1_PHYNI|nr:hypothetical protein F444_09205 [Phytophthora nicotianae P1976]
MVSVTGNVNANAAPTLDEKTWVQLHNWADSTTQEWTKQIKAVMTRQQRCENMARLRVLKKSEFLQLRKEREQLESQVKKCLATMNREGNTSSELYRAVHRLALECDSLRTKNVELMEEIQQQERFQSLVQARAIGVIQDETEDIDSSSPNVYTASKSSPWVSSSDHDDGWRVKFPNGEPSFHFHPFTKAEYDTVMLNCDNKFSAKSAVAGHLFGWTVYHAPLTRRLDNSLVGHARLSARVCCSFDEADAAVSPSKLNEWPLVFTPPNWSHSQRSVVSIQVLQSFAMDAHVLVCNIPGPVHTRYFQFARRQLKVEANGKRSFTCSLVLADSKENASSRAAEEPQPDVKWINEGGARMKFTEVDDTTIDVHCDTWASCEDELHARHLFIRWAQFVCRWSQGMMASKLIEGDV